MVGPLYVTNITCVCIPLVLQPSVNVPYFDNLDRPKHLLETWRRWLSVSTRIVQITRCGITPEPDTATNTLEG